jgi:nucleoside-triphosphatase
MKLHLFLTGQKGIGKSTIIKKVTQNLELSIGGFETYKGIGNDQNIYISPWNKRYYDIEHQVGIRDGIKADGKTYTFDNLGVQILETSNKTSQLIIMDELGFLENKADNFQTHCLKTISNDIPVLGVIKEQKGLWLDKIRNHKNVQVIQVTIENRNQLVNVITNHFKNKNG